MVNGLMMLLTNVTHVTPLVKHVTDQIMETVYLVTNQDTYKKVSVLIHVPYNITMLTKIQDNVENVMPAVKIAGDLVITNVIAVLPTLGY